MTKSVALPDSEEIEAETAALEAAVAEARADLREVAHADMRLWLLEVAKGNFDTAPPKPLKP